MAVTKWYYQDPDTDQRAGPVSVEFIKHALNAQEFSGSVRTKRSAT